MGVYTSTFLVAGVELDGRVVQKTITKYHEDTGQPYQNIVSDLGWYAGDTLIDTSRMDDSARDKFLHGSSVDDRCRLFGVAVELTDEDGPIAELPPPERQVAMLAEASAELNKHGYTGPIRLMVVQYTAY